MCTWWRVWISTYPPPPSAISVTSVVRLVEAGYVYTWSASKLLSITLLISSWKLVCLSIGVLINSLGEISLCLALVVVLCGP